MHLGPSHRMASVVSQLYDRFSPLLELYRSHMYLNDILILETM